MKVWLQHLEKIGTRCSRMGPGRASGRNKFWLGGGWVEGYSGLTHDTLGKTPDCPLPPNSKAGATIFANRSSQTFSQIPKSALCVETLKHRVGLGRYSERPPAGQKYVLAVPQAPPCYGLSILPAGRNQCVP